MIIEFSLTKEAIIALSAETEWRGHLPVILRRGTSAAIIFASAGARGKDAEPLTEDEQVLLMSWNEHPYIAARRDNQKRNQPTTEGDLFSVRKDVRLALQLMGVDFLVSAVQAYLDACAQKKHISQGRNRGYRNLCGLLSRLVEHYKDKTIPWWDVHPVVVQFQDSHGELTENIADAFAGQFLGRQSFGLQNPSTDYEHFMKAGDWVKRLCAATPGQWSEDDVVKYLMDCLARQYDGKTVVPGHTDSDHTWGTLMPQHLKQIMGA